MKENNLKNAWSNNMTVRERRGLFVVVTLYFILVPAGCTLLYLNGKIDENEANILSYAITFAYVLIGYLDFLRREFDTLCDNGRRIILELLISYAAMYCFNIIVNTVIGFSDNPNNNAIMETTGTNMKVLAAMTVIMAPFVEELIFRAGVFGLLRRKNRAAAYAASVLLFSLYHVISYAIVDPSNWIYILQYIPVSFLLCRIYERTRTIWSSILFHMLVNLLAVLVLRSAA